MNSRFLQLISRYVVCGATAVCLLSVCTNTPMSSDGGGSRGGNPVVVGTIKDSHGAKAGNVSVILIPEKYNPVIDTGKSALTKGLTDSQGAFLLSAPDTGLYNIEAVEQGSGARLIIYKIRVLRDSIIVVPPDTLQVPGILKVALPTGGNAQGMFIYVPGTTIAKMITDAADTVKIDSVPEGVIPVVCLGKTSTTETTTLRYNIRIISNDIAVIRYPGWNYYRKLTLNTTAAGADVKSDVYRFPVLVRLTSKNFNFDQAKSDGGDIRFSTSSGSPLQYEIENWDVSKNSASIWVNVDTVLGNNDTQSISMYWGNVSVSTSSNSSKVFDTASGFQGVWHLADRVYNLSNDATVNNYYGISSDSAIPQSVEGLIANCRKFDGINDFITMPNTASGKLNFPTDGQFTVSAWVSLDTLDGSPQLVVAKGYEQYFLRCTYFPSDAPLWEFSEFNSSNSWQTCTTTASARKWYYLTGVRMGNKHVLYCNGVVVDSIPETVQSVDLTRNATYDISIGKFLKLVKVSDNLEQYCFFKGSIDEVRIDNKSRSDAWVRLCYMNQQQNDRLVEFR